MFDIGIWVGQTAKGRPSLPPAYPAILIRASFIVGSKSISILGWGTNWAPLLLSSGRVSSLAPDLPNEHQEDRSDGEGGRPPGKGNDDCRCVDGRFILSMSMEKRGNGTRKHSKVLLLIPRPACCRPTSCVINGRSTLLLILFGRGIPTLQGIQKGASFCPPVYHKARAASGTLTRPRDRPYRDDG